MPREYFKEHKHTQLFTISINTESTYKGYYKCQAYGLLEERGHSFIGRSEAQVPKVKVAEFASLK